MLKLGADANSKDRNGATPLDYAVLDFATLSGLDPASLPPDRQQIYDALRAKGGRHIQ